MIYIIIILFLKNCQKNVKIKVAHFGGGGMFAAGMPFAGIFKNGWG